ncbi:SusD/RagB family nutrient-binding outer membrane lipoprotein [Flavihumibacter sp. CACIAM 22H1]|uniref:SusD/RagB family nutrient-binding outer membrane lipoprotein n=1 Tax=Flavihumibacter sp. CACIAM 22H1 TaxID=1812911 RepID=UPI0007A88125|nr:SusD/RagB family nutrient-binding outer membrane lipoprotein [Flavihumibacter sp. CACIAM 22H1]KYP16386.1 MAG: hypothetical protein A1D16_17160 [Flavihumibacter sp. CACIAM 22H1]
MKKILFILCSGLLVLAAGCKKFIDVNNDPNRPIDVQEAAILPPVELAVSHLLNAGFAAILAQHYTQAVCLNQPVPNEGTYLLVNGQMDGDWNSTYVTCLNNLKQLINKAEAGGSYAYAGIGKILSAYCYGTATDFWGDIPYTEALLGSDKFTPVYSSQTEVYQGIQSLLDAGIADLAKTSVKNPANDDFFYRGNLEKWTKLAYTLKARYYIHLTKSGSNTPATLADLALGALNSGMSSNADDLKMGYPGGAGNENPWYLTFLPGSTLVLSAHLVDGFVDRNDPRLPVIIAPAKGTGLYTGRAIGTRDVGNLEAYSIPAAFYGSAGSDHFLVNYSEALFIKAEATLIKSGAAAAQPVYQDGIRSHMLKLGLDPAGTAVSDYLADRGTLTAGNALERIMEEKAIANFLNTENWADWRRTGFPQLTKVPNALSEIPRRLLYPQVEIISNPQPQQAATLTDRIWWDAQ